MPSARPVLAAAAALAALAIPATADAKPKPKPATKHEQSASHGGHKVSLLLRGTWSGDGMQVDGGNHAARRAGLVGQSVTLDLASAKLRLHDANGDGTRDAQDLSDGDRVVVQVRVARGDVAAGTLTVRKLVARTQSADDQGTDDQSTDDSGTADSGTADAPADDGGSDA